MSSRPPYVWDDDIDETQFREILAGRGTIGRLDRDWAAVRLLEYAPYREIVRRGVQSPCTRTANEAQDKNLEMLLDWISQYAERDDTFSRAAHLAFYENYQGRKRVFTSNEEACECN